MGHHPQIANSRQTIFQKLVLSWRRDFQALRSLAVMGLIFVTPPLKSAPATGKTLGVLGDSLSTGAAAHPALMLDTNALWKVFQNPQLLAPRPEHLNQNLPWIAALTPETAEENGVSPLKPPQKAWPTIRELTHGIDYTFLNFVNALSQAFLNLEEYSWSYQLAPTLAVAPEQVIIAAENGAKAISLNRQIDRLVAANQGTLTDIVFIFFTGNDICGPTPESITPAPAYADTILGGLEYLARQKRPETGVKVYVLSYLNITQISTRREILDKKLEAFGVSHTCQSLHAQGFKPTPDQLQGMHEEFVKKLTTPSSADQSSPQPPYPAWWPWLFVQLMPPSPADMCPNLFAYGEEPLTKEKNLSMVANQVREYRQLTKEAIEGFRKKNPELIPQIDVSWVDGLEELLFDDSDIANDCFHLSGKGQGKLALKIFERIQGKPE